MKDTGKFNAKNIICVERVRGDLWRTRQKRNLKLTAESKVFQMLRMSKVKTIDGTPVGPGKDTHGTLGPGQWGGRGWPDINDTNVKSKCNDASLKHSKTPVLRQTENVDTLYFEEQVRRLDDL